MKILHLRIGRKRGDCNCQERDSIRTDLDYPGIGIMASAPEKAQAEKNCVNLIFYLAELFETASFPIYFAQDREGSKICVTDSDK